MAKILREIYSKRIVGNLTAAAVEIIYIVCNHLLESSLSVQLLS